MNQTCVAFVVTVLLSTMRSSPVYAQSALSTPLSLSTRTPTVAQLLDHLEATYLFRLAYSESHTDVEQIVRLASQTPTVQQVLDAISEVTNTTYQLRGNQIVLRASEKRYTISGYVKDADTGESLIGANVVERTSRQGTSSNTYGFYSLTLASKDRSEADTVTVLFSYVGYQARAMQLVLSQDTTLNVALTDHSLLDEVVVTATQAEEIQELTQMSTVSVPIEQIKAAPALLGEVDVLKTLQLLPGVQSGNEGTSGLYVRGGGPDQNLILLDGVPVYNASHLFGFFSVFNADAINHVQLIKGGFPARYGGRLSSVVDVSMKEGNTNKFHGTGSLGLVAGKLTLEGPIVTNKTSFIVSGRRTWIDALMPLLTRARTGGRQTQGYYFYDVNAKVNHRFSDRDRLFLSTYTGSDRYYSRSRSEEEENAVSLLSEAETELSWGNTTSALRWNHIFTSKLFSNLALTYSHYRLNLLEEYRRDYLTDNEQKMMNAGLINYTSGIRDVTAKLDLDYIPSPRHYVRGGASAVRHQFTPGVLNVRYTDVPTAEPQDTLLGSQVTRASEFACYAEDDIEMSRRLKLNVGIHFSGFLVNGKRYLSAQPRLAARYLLYSPLSLKASYARMTQFVHLLVNSRIGLPTDLWVPVTDRIRPQSSQQWALGVARAWKQDYEVSLEGYYKTMNNVIAYREGASFLSVNRDWQEKVVVGNGRAYGAELLVQKKEGRTTGWLGYTLSWSERQFEDLNAGQRFPYKYDRRHDIGLALMHQWRERVDVSLAWVFGTGNSVTLPVVKYAGTERQERRYAPFVERYQYSERNGYRMRPFHRLDVSVSFKKQTRWGERSWVVGAYNAYSRRNPFYLYVEQENPTFISKLRQVSLFPIIPSVSYQFTF